MNLKRRCKEIFYHFLFKKSLPRPVMKRPTGTIMKATLHLFPLTGLNLCVPVVNNYADIMWRCVIVVIDFTDTAVLRRRIYTEDKAKVVAAV